MPSYNKTVCEISTTDFTDTTGMQVHSHM